MFAVGKLTLVIFIGAEFGICILEFDLYKLIGVVFGANVEGKFAAYISEWGKFEGILFVITFAVTKFFCLEVSMWQVDARHGSGRQSCRHFWCSHVSLRQI